MPPFRPRVWRPQGTPETASLAADFYATKRHFVDHLAPVYLAMERRGRFCVPDGLMAHARRLGIEPAPESKLAQGEGPIVFSAYGDLRRCVKSGRHLILFEHGAGFSFSNSHPSYAGGAQQRDRVGLFCEVNDWTARRNRAKYPGCRSVVVGSPKMDALAHLPRREMPARPTVCIAFHWDCIVAPETRSAYAHFASALPDLAREFDLILHAHPRQAEKMRAVADHLGVEFAEEFADVCERADVYVNDASSTLYEFAALGRPVVVMNAPWYRRHVHHGLRFWDCCEVGVNCDEPAKLVAAVHDALADTEERIEYRAEVSDDVFPYLGHAAERAAYVLESYGDLVKTGRMYPREPEALPEGCRVDCEDECTVDDVLRWHGAHALLKGLSRSTQPVEYVARLGKGVRVTASLEPAFRALAAGWDHVAIEVPYDFKASGKGRFLKHDPRASFHRVGAPDDGPTWLMDASFALEFEG